MRKCKICGEKIPFGEKHVKVATGKWYKRKRYRFHISCFLDDRAATLKILRDLRKRE